MYKAKQIFPQFHFKPPHAKRLYLHMFDIVDTPFSYERELIVCSFDDKNAWIPYVNDTQTLRKVLPAEVGHSTRNFCI